MASCLRCSARATLLAIRQHQARAYGSLAHEKAAVVLPNTIDTTSPQFQQNQDSMNALIASTKALAEQKRLGGPQKARDRHVAKGKLLPRQRCALSSLL